MSVPETGEPQDDAQAMRSDMSDKAFVAGEVACV
jgi:hypothetical protein